VSVRRDTFVLWSLVGLLAVTLLWPIWMVLRGAFQDGAGDFTLAHLQDVFRDPLLVQGFGNSFRLAACTTLLATALAFPLATVGARCAFKGKALLNAFVLAPLILPPFVGAIGLRQVLGRMGALNALLQDIGLTSAPIDFLGDGGFWSIVAIQGFSLYPIIYLNLVAALSNIDPALEEAARGVGAGAFTRWRRVTLPMVRGGLFAGATIVFIWSFTELGTPLMFGYNDVTSVQIFNGLKEVENSSRPYVLTAFMLGAAILLYLLGKKVFGGQGYAMYSKASRAGGEKPLAGTSGWLATGAFALVTAAAVMPHLGVLLTSVTVPGQWYKTVLPAALTGDHYGEALGAAEAFGSIRNSLMLASAAMVIDCVAGVLVAYMIVRTKVVGRALLDALCMLPLAVPGLVMAFGYVAISLEWPFGANGPLSSFASIFAVDPSPVPFLIVAYATRRLPYIVRSTIAGLEQTSGELEEAAVNLGASRFTAVRRVIVPLIAANIIAGGLLVFSFSMLEVSDSLLLAQQASDFPITKQIWAFMDRLGDGPYIASAMGVWGMALLTVTIFAASLLMGKKMGSIFRV